MAHVPAASPTAMQWRRLAVLLSFFAAFSCACEQCDVTPLENVACNPGAPSSGRYDASLPEQCDNLIDDNCDGLINEGCTCVDGDLLSCGSDVGECVSATVACVDGRLPGCAAEVYPTTEICNLRDDDCNGGVDDITPSECWTGPLDAVFEDPAICRFGILECVDGRTECVGQILPEDERCDGRTDEDCDGAVDGESVAANGRQCGPPTAVGACDFGTEHCIDGESYCVGAIFEEPEQCDGFDNDCDGTSDEDEFGVPLRRFCETACGIGREVCSDGGWVDCTAPQPEIEICDDLDNDCDGRADEDLLCFCVVGDAETCAENVVDEQGNPVDCGIGVKICDGFGRWGPCIFARETEEICNNHDDDCDGAVDGLSRVCGDPATAGIGVCVLGTDTCEAGVWNGCLGAVSPTDEVCDGLDNDCDGLIDEDLDPHDKVDMIFLIDDSGSMCPKVVALNQGIAGYIGDFSETEHRIGLAVFPGYLGSDPLAWLTSPPLVDALAFQNALAAYDCNGGSWEPSYDAIALTADPANPEAINWRTDAYPYVIMIGDEPAQTFTGLVESDVAALTSSCGLPGCSPGDRIEAFVITPTIHFPMYDEIVFFESERLVEIAPPSASRYTQILRDIFTNVCLPPPEEPAGGGP